MILIARVVCFCGAVLIARMVVLLDDGSVVDFDVVLVTIVLRSSTLEEPSAVASGADRCLAFLAASSSLSCAVGKALVFEVFDVVAEAVTFTRFGWSMEASIELLAAFRSALRCNFFLRASSPIKQSSEVCTPELDSSSEEDCWNGALRATGGCLDLDGLMADPWFSTNRLLFLTFFAFAAAKDSSSLLSSSKTTFL